MISRESVVARSDHLLVTEVDEEKIMLDLDEALYYGLDPIASRIWSLLEQPRAVTELCGLLVAEYEVDFDRCLGDVVQVLNQMLEKKIVYEPDSP